LINARNGITEVTEALDEQKASFDDLLSATLSAFNSDIAYEKAKRATGDALAEVTELQKALTDGTYEGDDALRDLVVTSEDFILTALEQGASAVRAAEDLAKKTGAELTAEAAAKIHREELIRVANTLDPNSPLRRQLLGYASELGAIPKNVSTTIRTNYITTEQRIIINEQRTAVTSSGMGARANGGIITKPEISLIGEAGTEVIIPLSRPNRAMELMQETGLDMLAMSSVGANKNSGGGNTIINISVEAGLVSSPDQVGQQIIEAIRRAERRSGQVFAAA
jgi:hypothetical protein